MKRQLRLLLGATGFALVAGLAITASSVVHSKSSRPELTESPDRQLVVDDFADNAVCLEWVEPTADGHPAEVIHDVYCNGDLGIRQFHPGSQILSSKTIWFKNSNRVRFTASYAADGQQIVKGFERRSDGSTLWTATLESDGTVVTMKYWFDGSLFSLQKRKLGQRLADIVYFYRNGQRSAHLVGYGDIPFAWATRLHVTVDDYSSNPVKLYLGRYEEELPLELAGKQLLNQAEAWTPDGKPLLSIKVDGDTRVYTVYRADGTRWYEQTYGAGHDFGVGSDGTRDVIVGLNIYSDDGTRLVRRFDGPTFGLNHAVDYKPDGSRVEYGLQGNEIWSIDRYNAKGTLVGHQDLSSRKTKPLIQLDGELVKESRMPDPTKDWQEAEEKHFSSTLVQ